MIRLKVVDSHFSFSVFRSDVSSKFPCWYYLLTCYLFFFFASYLLDVDTNPKQFSFVTGHDIVDYTGDSTAVH